ncbi:MAG: hypothetical protein FRX49_01004 [Trebouxia sp. A1-2]|nr:MAG: hypothetical protein FRX49_01004 [Trebouxia sp. A1-2]
MLEGVACFFFAGRADGELTISWSNNEREAQLPASCAWPVLTASDGILGRLLLHRINKTVSLDKVAQLLLLYTSTCLKFAHATCNALSDKDGMPACKAASRMEMMLQDVYAQSLDHDSLHIS